MSSFTNYLEDAILDHVFRNNALTSPTTVYMALFTTAPTDAGGGTEVSGNGYSRLAVTFGAPSAGSVGNTGALDFVASGGNWGDVLAGAIFDASSGGNMLSWDDFPAATINDTDTLRFDAGDITVSLD